MKASVVAPPLERCQTTNGNGTKSAPSPELEPLAWFADEIEAHSRRPKGTARKNFNGPPRLSCPTALGRFGGGELKLKQKLMG